MKLGISDGFGMIFWFQKGRQFARCRGSLEPGALFTCSKGVAGGHLPCTVLTCRHFFCWICAQSRGESRRTTARGRREAKIGRSVRRFLPGCQLSLRKLDLIARMFELGHSRHFRPIGATSALPQIATLKRTWLQVSNVPIGDAPQQNSAVIR